MQLNSTFYHATTVYTCRRQAIIQVSCDSSCVQRRHQSHINWDNFINGAVVPEEWQENFCMPVQIALIDLSAKSASAWGGNVNNTGACGCFPEGDLHIVLPLLRWRERHQKTTKSFGLCQEVVFLSSSDKFVRLSSSFSGQINVTSKHRVQSPKWRNMSLVSYGSFWLHAHIEVKQLIANPSDQITEKENII